MSSDKQIQVDSRAWTGDIMSESTPENSRFPVSWFSYKASDPPASMLCFLMIGLALLAFGVGILSDRMPSIFADEYLVASPVWHNSVTIIALCFGVLFFMVAIATRFVATPAWSGRLCFMIAATLILAAAADYGLVIRAHDGARLVGGVEPMLLAEEDGCRRGRSYTPGPCVHSFRVMDRSGKAFLIEGYGKATARACILVQKLSDGRGFVWYRRRAYYDLLPTIGLHDFTPDIGDRCLRRGWQT